MSAESFLHIAWLLREASLLVQSDGTIVAANPAALALTRQPSLAYQRLHELVQEPPDEIDRMLDALAHGEQPDAIALTWRAAGGQPATLCSGSLHQAATSEGPALVQLICTGDSPPLETAVAAPVVSAEAQGQRASELDEQRERLRVTLASIGDGVIATDCAGRVTFMNPMAEQLTGWNNDEARGLPLAEVFHIISESSRKVVESPVKAVLETGSLAGLAGDSLLVARNGVERPIDDSAAPIRDAQQNMLGVVLVFHDVTERRHAEQVLAASEERFRLLVDGVQDYAIMMLGLEGEVVSWNEGAERILGYSAQQVLHKNYRIFYTPEDVQNRLPERELEIAINTGRAIDENWMVRANGTRFWASGVNNALLDARGKLRGFAKIFRDLTERKQLEEELRYHTEELALADLRKDEFLTLLGHELRNPLAAISNALRVKEVCAVDDPASAHADGVVARQTKLLSRLVDDLLDVSQITRGKVELRHQRVELGHAVRAALETVRPQIEAKQQRLEVSFPPEPMWLSADAARLEQVIVNLLNNAAKYTDKGGKISLAVYREAGSVVVRVRDTGVGIAKEMLGKVFDLFTQAGDSPDRAPGGLGIGLTLVRSLVELHGGHVEARSEGIGRGSEFVVRFPELPTGLRTGTPPPKSARSVKRVLIVDDNLDIARMMAAVVRHFGHEIRTAHEGYSALSLAQEYKPEVVLLDIGLPGISGYEVAQRLRESGMTDTLLVAVTGYGQEADRRRSQQAGFDYHLVKPVSLHTLEGIFRGLA